MAIYRDLSWIPDALIFQNYFTLRTVMLNFRQMFAIPAIMMIIVGGACGPVKAASVEALLTGILYAKNEVENATDVLP